MSERIQNTKEKIKVYRKTLSHEKSTGKELKIIILLLSLQYLTLFIHYSFNICSFLFPNSWLDCLTLPDFNLPSLKSPASLFCPIWRLLVHNYGTTEPSILTRSQASILTVLLSASSEPDWTILSLAQNRWRGGKTTHDLGNIKLELFWGK